MNFDNNSHKASSFKFSLKLSNRNDMKIFNYEKYRKSRDVLSIASSIFELEKKLKIKKIDTIHIERFVKNHMNGLKTILSDLVSYVLLEKVEIEFFDSKKDLNNKKNIYTKTKTPKIMVLFSGGVDSTSGILWTQRKYSNKNKKIIGIFCAHSDQAWGIHIVNNLSEALLLKMGIDLKTVYVPPITKGGYAQLRGFLYILSAGAWMEILNSNTLVISECGPTMYQPRFGPFDSVTMTTHPFVTEASKAVLESLLGRKIDIIMPFENMTKAEVISISSNKNSLKNTHSCVTQRFGKHDGTCYGCVIRRLGAITAGVEDVEYLRDPISDENAQNENLLSLLLFSQDILGNYENMPLYEIENIEAYGKQDLFRRFSLDNFAAIHILEKKGIPIIMKVNNIYKEILEEIGPDILNKRIKDVRNGKFQINTESI